jgi:hypothetical protein
VFSSSSHIKWPLTAFHNNKDALYCGMYVSSDLKLIATCVTSIFQDLPRIRVISTASSIKLGLLRQHSTTHHTINGVRPAATTFLWVEYD